MSPNPFAEVYKKLSNADLMEIISNPKDYQALALEAARSEFESRKLTDEQKMEAKRELLLKLEEADIKRRRVLDIEEKLKYTGRTVFEKFIPVMNEPRPTLNKTNLISLLLSISYFFYFVSEIDFLIFKFTYYDEDRYDFFISLLPIIVFPIIVFLFWKRKKSGWILLTILFSFSASGILFLFISEFYLFLTNRNDINSPYFVPFELILPFLIFLVITWYFCRKQMRDIYKIDGLELISSLIFGISIALIVITST